MLRSFVHVRALARSSPFLNVALNPFGSMLPTATSRAQTCWCSQTVDADRVRRIYNVAVRPGVQHVHARHFATLKAKSKVNRNTSFPHSHSYLRFSFRPMPATQKASRAPSKPLKKRARMRIGPLRRRTRKRALASTFCCGQSRTWDPCSDPGPTCGCTIERR